MFSRFPSAAPLLQRTLPLLLALLPLTAYGHGSSSSGQEEPDSKHVLRLAYAHGWLMAIGLGLFIPCGVLVARYGKEDERTWWFLGHRALAGAGFVLALFSCGVVWRHIVAEGGKGTPHYKIEESKGHGAHGLAIMLLLVVQVLMGASSPKKPAAGESKSKMRRVFEVVHRLNGGVILVWTVPQMLTGLQLVGKRKFAYAYTALVVALLAAVVVLQFRAWYIADQRELDGLRLQKVAKEEIEMAIMEPEVEEGLVTSVNSVRVNTVRTEALKRAHDSSEEEQKAGPPLCCPPAGQA